ncbi:MAG: hypothetical protein IT430_20450 [Phycisphaerales bacterium]|nr:hypothetical protein [Phycisphaerales bacterium]
MTPRPTAPEHLVWPAERFFWGVLDTSALPSRLGRSRPDPKQLGFLFEEMLPCPIEDVQAVYLPQPGRRFIACGILRTQLEQLPAATLTLAPQCAPSDIIGDAPLDCRQINLLTGPFEPAPLRRLRRAARRDLIAIAALLLLVLWLGAQRRITALDAARANLDEMRGGVYSSLLDASAPPSSQPPALRLLAELRQLRATRAERSTSLPQPESARSLEALLRQWPGDQPVRTESISITSSAITVIGVLPTPEQAQRFAGAFEALPGWQARQPQVDSTGDGVRLTLRWRRAADHDPRPSGAAPATGGGL